MNNTATHKILIIDNEPFIVEELCEFFCEHGHSCVGAGSSQEAFERFHGDPAISIVLTDLYMPGINGIQLVQTLHEQAGGHRSFEAILFTGQSDKQDVIQAMRTGFADYYQKPLHLADLLAGVERLASRLDKRNREQHLGNLSQRLQNLTSSLEELCLDIHKFQQLPAQAPEAHMLARQPADSLANKLSRRQFEVLQLISRGMTNYQIACALGIRENTVKLYVSQILRITNMHNRTQLALALSPSQPYL
ncbi:DNA-binding response regulator [Stutzerimonas stutzeri]|uniref:DNA-binding response regulator n=1 Tax=Stutzerimonas stutzeri TaxID=316 RepID=A0A2N8STM4_STUST|nr:response regulator transcription factor [Stutzerimonas stutzeri]MCQ4325813.1 response regulator transcription factor [Stutzerimonas stutzeri]PNG05813.1 DNA-binding response regulator [Stutzerimonas stutzeri]